MTSVVSSVSQEKMNELISTVDGGKLTEKEREIFARYIFVSSMLWLGTVNDKLLCMWGLIPPTLISDRAYLWLHTTEAAEEHTFVLVRRSQIEMKKMLADYPIIVGHCQVGADRSIRWLKWLGAEFHEPMGPLVPFTIRNKNG